jgi:hypothetical protein
LGVPSCQRKKVTLGSDTQQTPGTMFAYELLSLSEQRVPEILHYRLSIEIKSWVLL